ncbi:ABC transporter ATP-binding protein [Arthrobacter sp. ISL-72]|uniref:ABC transporter ATP-binding protein n=1 Tax=Arthrobacter sp. ISL-72 TaxID=2819114 RepID=UPI001BE6C147|nr:ABC transporter ATP-binding protein [Arthrobacter sp. ISL-72]MBT2597179.1 ABC transporter ATP-binding protein [Arthrobacter sp. ISL-72]
MTSTTAADGGGAGAWSTSRRLLGLLRPVKWRMLGAVAATCAFVALNVSSPKLLGDATDVVVEGVFGGTFNEQKLASLLLLVAVMYVGASAFSWVQGAVTATAVQRVSYRLRAAVEDKLPRLPSAHFDEQRRGDVLSRATNDVDNISQALNQLLNQLILSVLMLLGALSMMLWLSPLLAVIALVSVPLSTVATVLIARKSSAHFSEQWSTTGELNAHLEEYFTGHEVLKAFGRQAMAAENFTDSNHRLSRTSARAQYVSGAVQPLLVFVSNLNYIAVAVVGALQVTAGAMTIGGVQAFIQFSRLFSQPIGQIGGMLNLIQSCIASAERVFALLDAAEIPPDGTEQPAKKRRSRRRPPVGAAGRVAGRMAGPAESGPAVAAPSFSAPSLSAPSFSAPSFSAPSPDGATGARVVFEAVTFGYSKDAPVVHDLSFTAEPGQTVAIVGHTGAGKTTVVNLLMRFYELHAGRITIDGVDIAERGRDELRSMIGMVLQDAWVFSGSIRENIEYGRPGASDADILAAAETTLVDHFVRALPDGYATVLGNDGDSLSHGQRQLITIARAQLAGRSILVLDEATSSVDTRTEVQIRQAMQRLRQGRTSFVIAHRLSTVRDADLILVMDHGRIVEHGNHQQLLAANGHYSRLYDAQFAGGEEALRAGESRL